MTVMTHIVLHCATMARQVDVFGWWGEYLALVGCLISEVPGTGCPKSPGTDAATGRGSAPYAA